MQQTIGGVSEKIFFRKMTKIKLVVLAVIVATVFFIIGCDKIKNSDEISNHTSTTTEYSEDEIVAAIGFVGQGKVIKSQAIGEPLEVQMKALNGKAIKFTIARPKKNCMSGFGLCNPHVIDIKDIASLEDNAVYMNISDVDWNNFNIKLAYSPSIDLSNVEFNVDEDLEVFDFTKGEVIATIKADAYPFTKTISTDGGFALKAIAVKAK
jgi:type III secretory pathway component EscV